MKLILLIILALNGYKVYSQVNLNQGLVAYWNFNGSANDMSGNNNNGIVNGTTTTTGYNGVPNTAYYFNGSTNYIEVPNSPTLYSFDGDTFSIYALVKAGGFYSGLCHGNIIVDKGYTDNSSGHYSLRFSDAFATNFTNCSNPVNNTVQGYYIHATGLNVTYPSAYLPYIDTSSWDCVIVTCATDSSRLYVNGVLKQVAPKTGALGYNFHNLFIGKKNSNQYPYWFKGVMDEIRIYNRAINIQEIDSLCNLFKNPPFPTSVTANFGYINTLVYCDSATYSFTDMSTAINSNILSWSWDFGDGNSLNQQNATHTYTSPGTYNVKLKVTNSVNQIDSMIQTINISFLPTPTVIANANNTQICLGQSVTLYGSGAFSYQWTGGVSNGIPFFLAATNTFTVTGTDMNGCTNTDSITVNVSSGLNISVSPTQPILCKGDSIMLTATGALNYIWNNTPGLSNYTGATVWAFPNVNTTYTVTGTDSNGCIGTTTATINFLNLPNISISPGQPLLCIGDSVKLTASGGVSYIWNNTPGLSNYTDAIVWAFPDINTTYTVVGTDSNGCKDTAIATVNMASLPIVSISPTDPILCVGDTITLTATGGASHYTWESAPGLIYNGSAATLVNPTANTTYTVTGFDSNGCKGTATITVLTYGPINVLATKNQDVLCDNNTIQLSAQGADTYTWIPAQYISDPNGAITYATINETTTFYLTGISGPCSASDSVTVYVYDNSQNGIFVPNAFSPNGDNLNDCLRIKHNAIFEKYYFTIYNRRGQKVFETHDPNACWDGNINNKELALDTYFYFLKAKTACGNIFKKGDIIIVR